MVILITIIRKYANKYQLDFYISINNFIAYLNELGVNSVIRFMVQLTPMDNNTCAKDPEYSRKNNKHEFKEGKPVYESL